MEECHLLDTKRKLYTLSIRRLAYPMCLENVLKELPKGCRSGSDNRSLMEKTSLVVHVITSTAMLDLFRSEDELKYYWEQGFAHQYPNIKQMELVFILQGTKSFNPYSNMLPMLSQPQQGVCSLCTDENRIVTYSFQPMLYHMFFSSPEYTEPDIVVAFDNNQEMMSSGSKESAIHTHISYRNMIYNLDTLLFLMDTTKDLVKQGVGTINAVDPVEQLVSIKRNSCGLRCNFTCLRRKLF